jgi:hypothetical protein
MNSLIKLGLSFLILAAFGLFASFGVWVALHGTTYSISYSNAIGVTYAGYFVVTFALAMREVLQELDRM